MPAPLAAILTVAFIIFLFRRDVRAHPNITRALWLPFIWMVINGSRAVTEWLRLCGFSVGGSLEEGSPIDRLFYIVLIVAGVMVLRRRNVRLGQLMRNNQWLAAFLIYCLLSVLWSDFPFVALKRWIKVIGHPIMVLIILTEPDPEAAFVTVMKRVAYILLPVSVLFIKYYPELGRDYSAWSGAAIHTGITTNKNLLGLDCLIMGYFFFWHFLNTRLRPRSRVRRNELILCGVFLFMTAYLFNHANSQTPQTALALGVFMLLFLGSKLVNKRMIGTYIITGVIALVVCQGLFDIYGVVLGLLGRDATLTERTLLWRDLLKMDINPILGAGFESFWMGDRLAYLWRVWNFRPNQAHNGYLETYLNLGLIGLFMLLGLLVATYAKARRDLSRSFEWGRFRLGFLASSIIYNWTEAGFKTVGFVFFMFYIIAIDFPKRQPTLFGRGVSKRRELIGQATEPVSLSGLRAEERSVG